VLGKRGKRELLSFRFHNKEHPMLYAGCDLHKQTISICVMNPARQIVKRERLRCADETAVRRFFEELGEFEAVVEATASYEWFIRLIEPLARRVVLAHPKKLRVIAESTRKSDKLDAQVLAEFLAPRHDPGLLPAHAPPARASPARSATGPHPAATDFGEEPHSPDAGRLQRRPAATV
jgi:hypothetical protein